MINSKTNTKEFLTFDEEQKIADMNIKGMPWYEPRRTCHLEEEKLIQPLNRKETLRIMFSALGAALVVGCIFLFAFFLFILFCLNIWFK